MKRFRSPFGRVLDIRQQMTRVAEMALARERAALDAAQAALRDSQAAVMRDQEQLSRTLEQSGDITMIRALHHQIELALSRVQQTRQTVQAAESAVQEAMQQVQRAKTDQEAVQRLVQRQQEEHRKEALRDEQLQIDEAGLGRHARRVGAAMEGA
ncbi:Flagellar FliJ protein [Maioricimonas rarisocia]|uniref:Flagellar FliJ protein n=1 Tax=Maioricimonas rarisocia TaxID=2528026 RepID=A0A517ZCQ6_9PLAN|nr:flagellar FliJ family protein [Maioricimonas rarisocia]QDU40249.1 Flagellar FliJ protein [Maioricimonas rarisocia]